MQARIERVESALNDLKLGKMVILTDHPERENEGDLIVAAEKITPAIMNFMIRQGTGIVCLPMTTAWQQKLDLPLMITSDQNNCMRGTQFTISIDAKEGISTGVSAEDRCKTVECVMNSQARPQDLVRPGHLFPLLAKEGGVLERQGHTEGSIDLVRLAGFQPVSVLCEIMNVDGSMTRGLQLHHFANTHQLKILSIEDIIAYRLLHENRIEDESTALLPLEKYGNFKITVIKEKGSNQEHIILEKEGKSSPAAPLVRLHSCCLTGDIFASKRCDCQHQLHYSLERISEEGGFLIYLNQEGRGIGLFNKIKAYALQEQGHDTVEANTLLGLPADSRQYSIAANILRNKDITKVRLLTNNPNKISDLKDYGITEVEQERMPSFHNEYNQTYLKTKNDKLKHTINFDLVSTRESLSNEK